MNEDLTEQARRQMVAELNALPVERKDLEAEFGQVWDTAELQRDFVVESFLAPFVICKSKKTGKPGTLMFQHSPRFYFRWREA